MCSYSLNCLFFTGEPITSPLGSVDFLNNYQRILRGRFLPTRKALLDFNGEVCYTVAPVLGFIACRWLLYIVGLVL